MSRLHRALTTRLAWALLPVLAAGCVGSLPGTQNAAPSSQQLYQLERQVTLQIDPTTGQVTAPRGVLATIESQLNLDFDAVNLTQANGNTSFNLTVANKGSALSNLQLRLSSANTLVSPSNPIDLGAVAAGGQTSTPITYGNASGQAFTVTIYLWATMTASGSQDTGASTAWSPASPTPTPTATPTSTATATPTPAPTATPTPAPVASSSVVLAPNPGPLAVRGRILSNGNPASGWTSQSFSYGRVELSLKRVSNGSWVQSIPVTTDSQGYFTAQNVTEGDYIAYFYNEVYRDRMGVWKSLPVHVDATTGGAFPVVDLYLVGQQNTPLPGTQVSLPANFGFNLPIQPMVSQRFRVHSAAGTSFSLIYVSNKFPGDQTTFTWDGSGASQPLDPTHDYFWGLEWDGGQLGAFGNLYQKIRFSQ